MQQELPASIILTEDGLYRMPRKYLRKALSMRIGCGVSVLLLAAGLHVYWWNCSGFEQDQLAPRVSIAPLRFNDGSPANSGLISGWSLPEPWGVWSEGNTAELRLIVGTAPLGASGEVASRAASAIHLVLEVIPFISPPTLLSQRIEILLDGRLLGTQTLNGAGVIEIALGTPFPGQRLIIKLDFPDATRPSDIGASSDRRQLAIGLKSAYIQM